MPINYRQNASKKSITVTVSTVQERNITLLTKNNSKNIVYQQIFVGGCKSKIILHFIKEVDNIIISRFSIRNICMFVIMQML